MKISAPPARLELLAPARNPAFGMAAVDHGADAVYIGGPAFGARAAAGNDMAGIADLAAYAHRYGARVYVALNTILRDEELEAARRIAWQAWDAGADALIVQDMGLLELDLPPLALHASTQTDNRTAAKVRFLEQAGFSQVVLARELTLGEIRAIAAETAATLEFFVHGALCVSYSGQCYISHARTGRSANRGECAQLCRLPYTLADADGRILAREKHVLSLKDNDQSDHLAALAEAGIRSFKIEGRLKDLAYVKNVTAWYRRRLDALLEERPDWRQASSGRCRFFFTPQPEKTFNRGSTDYFVAGRRMDIAALDTPKFAGEPVGRVAAIGRQWIDVEGDVPFNNGDGISWLDSRQELVGLRINRAEGRRLLVVAVPEGLVVGTVLYRNSDREFERQIEKKSAERRVGVRIRLAEAPAGLVLEVEDEDGIAVAVPVPGAPETARDAERAGAAWRDQLGKLGNTMFEATEISIETASPPFMPSAAINALRREAMARLEAARQAAYRRPDRAPAADPPALYPESELTYLGNVFNAKARSFYERHGVRLIEDAYECGHETRDVPLMTTRHCLRFSFSLCPKQVKGIRPDPMTIASGKERFTLRFDCRRCEMQVIGHLRTGEKPSG